MSHLPYASVPREKRSGEERRNLGKSEVKIFKPKTNITVFELRKDYDNMKNWLGDNFSRYHTGNLTIYLPGNSNDVIIINHDYKELTFIGDEIPQSLEKVVKGK